jgi:hypothetical protein
MFREYPTQFLPIFHRLWTPPMMLTLRFWYLDEMSFSMDFCSSRFFSIIRFSFWMVTPWWQDYITLFFTFVIYKSQFFTDMPLFVYIWSTSNIYWFISIRICCQQIQTNSYLDTFDYLYYSVSYSMSDNKDIFKLFAITYWSAFTTLHFFP